MPRVCVKCSVFKPGREGIIGDIHQFNSNCLFPFRSLFETPNQTVVKEPKVFIRNEWENVFVNIEKGEEKTRRNLFNCNERLKKLSIHLYSYFFFLDLECFDEI